MMNFTQTQNASQFAGPPSQSMPREGTVDLLALVNQINQQQRQLQEEQDAEEADRAQQMHQAAAQESQDQLENLQLKNEAPADKSQPLQNADSQRSGAPGSGFQSLFMTSFTQKYKLTPGCRSGVEIEREAQTTVRQQKDKVTSGSQSAGNQQVLDKEKKRKEQKKKMISAA